VNSILFTSWDHAPFKWFAGFCFMGNGNWKARGESSSGHTHFFCGCNVPRFIGLFGVFGVFRRGSQGHQPARRMADISPTPYFRFPDSQPPQITNTKTVTESESESESPGKQIRDGFCGSVVPISLTVELKSNQPWNAE